MDGGEHSRAGVLVGADSRNAAYEGGMVCRICFSNSARRIAASSLSAFHSVHNEHIYQILIGRQNDYSLEWLKTKQSRAV